MSQDIFLTRAPDNPQGLLKWVKDAISALQSAFRTHTHRFPGVIDGELRVNSYVMANRPAAANVPRAIIFVSDGGAGNQFQGSDGTNWLALG